MSSSVFFKFKSQKEPTRVEFDGTGISVFELKREVIIKSGLGDGTDFDLALYTEDNNEEYDDDTTIIPRSTTVIARRQPAAKPGAGRAARYVTGKMPVTAKNAARKEQGNKGTTSKSLSSAITQMNNATTEAERMEAMFQAQNEQLQANLDEIHQRNNVSFRPKKSTHVPDHEPPKGYVCHRCNKAGHWIQACPTNNDTEYDNRPRLKRTTGIPKAFLKTVEKEDALAMMQGDEKINLMKDGDQYFIAQVDTNSWKRFQEKAKASGASKADTAMEEDMRKKGLECPASHGDSRQRLCIDPMKTPCCLKTYCNDCITDALIESDFVCPACKQEGVLIDNLKPDDEATKKIDEFVKFWDDKKEKEREKEQQENSGAEVSPTAHATEESRAGAGATGAAPRRSVTPPKVSGKSPVLEQGLPMCQGAGPTKPVVIKVDDASAKKRPADELLENPKIPKGPRAMQQKEAMKQQQQQQQSMMNGMGPMAGGMPMMPWMSGFPMGMPQGMPNATMGMGMINPMMNPMMFNPMAGGLPNMNGNPMMGGGFGDMNLQGGMNSHHGLQNVGFNNGGAEDDAYFRKPVNPHRHQNRQRRVRPSDYREL